MNNNSGGEELTNNDKVDLRDADDCSSEGSSRSTSRDTDWKPCSKDVILVNEGMLDGVSPRQILQQLAPNMNITDEDLDDATIWQTIANILTEPPRRTKLPQYNTLDDAVQLIRNSSKIMVLFGAGVSVSCGIPDFRSRNGIYSRLRKDFPDLPRPESMFDIYYFKENPKPFYEFAREIFPGQFQPSLCHSFVKELECAGKLLRNYTQNIDMLEKIAGIERVLQCHGSFATASCCVCKHKVDCETIKEDIFQKIIPRCPKCPADVEFNFMKPDIVFFGEDLPGEFHEQITADKEQVDLLIVIGSSLRVRPVSLVPNSIPNNVPQILINREPLSHMNFDIELLGDCDLIVSELCLRLGGEWSKLSNHENILYETTLNEAGSSSKEENLKTLKRSSRAEATRPKRPRLSTEKRRSTDGHVQDRDKDESGSGDEVDSNLELLRKMYKPRMRNLAGELEENTYLFIPPNRTIFTGAEVFEPWSDDEDSETSSSASSEDEEGLEERSNSISQENVNE